MAIKVTMGKAEPGYVHSRFDIVSTIPRNQRQGQWYIYVLFYLPVILPNKYFGPVTT